MKKVLSLFVTIALLTASMVYFTGCQNMADLQIDPSEQPEEGQKHTVKFNYLKGKDEYTVGEELHLWIDSEIGAHTFVGVIFVDANTDVVLDVPYDIKYDKEHKNYTVCFTMPDADIVLKKFTIESIPVDAKDYRANYCICNFYFKKQPLKGNFKFAYRYIPSMIPDELKNVVKKVNDYTWIYEITDWIDNSKLCEPRIYYKPTQTGANFSTSEVYYEDEPYADIYYFYISGLDDVKSLELMAESESGGYYFYNLHDNTFKYF
jgi:hypothetical protein